MAVPNNPIDPKIMDLPNTCETQPGRRGRSRSLSPSRVTSRQLLLRMLSTAPRNYGACAPASLSDDDFAANPHDGLPSPVHLNVISVQAYEKRNTHPNATTPANGLNDESDSASLTSAITNDSVIQSDSSNSDLVAVIVDIDDVIINQTMIQRKDSINVVHLPIYTQRSGCTGGFNNKANEIMGRISKSFQLRRDVETSLSVALQLFIPFIIAGCGTVGAGVLLDIVQHWQVFEDISEIYILVPSLLGLKGNLEMTSAARLSTMVNLAETKLKKTKYLVTNMALVQAQAVVLGLLASLFATLLHFINTQTFSATNALILCASSLVTASLATLMLDSALVLVIFLAKKHAINPDNVATPLAASFGDLITLSLLAGTSTFFNEFRTSQIWVIYAAIALFLLLLPLWIWLSLNLLYAREVLKTGWPPIIISMMISSGGGYILNLTADRFAALAAFQPVVNGIGGNLVAIQASRYSTFLHSSVYSGQLPDSYPGIFTNPFKIFFGSDQQSKVARVLMAFVLPGHAMFMFVIIAIKKARMDAMKLTLLFAIFYLVAATLQVVLLLYCCIVLTNALWKFKMNPDNSAIPILTALGDLFGTGLLAAAFFILKDLGDPNSAPIP